MNKTKKAIFHSAIKIFSKSGYNGATMDDIAFNAGVAKGTLYYHFRSKEEIFKYIIKEGTSIIIERMECIAKNEHDALSKLKALCKIQLSLVYENRDFFKVIMSQLWGQELRQLELRHTIKGYINYIEKYLRQSIDEGSIKNGEVSFMAYTIFGTICSATVYELINEDDRDIHEVNDNLVGYILSGIKK